MSETDNDRSETVELDKYRLDTSRRLMDITNHSYSVPDWNVFKSYCELPLWERGLLEEGIKIKLGYRPDLSGYCDELLILNNFRKQLFANKITEEEYNRVLVKTAIKIRNADMKSEGWCNLDDDEKDVCHYANTFLAYKIMVREWLKKIFGYYPDLKISMRLEICLRKMLTELNSKFEEYDFYPVERKIIAIVEYRQFLLTVGIDAADNSPLFYYEEFANGENIPTYFSKLN